MTAEQADIKTRIQAIKSLPTLPGVVQRLLNMVESDATSVQEIGDIIAEDQVLSAKILKIVNSPFYGFPGRISTVQHALVLLGFNVIKGIVLSAAVIDLMADSIHGLWEHSLGVATAADHIARSVGAPETEEISTAGLLHDLGKVIISVEFGPECRRIQSIVEKEHISFREAEVKVLDGITHGRVAGWLAEQWNLPPRLREAMVRHHHPERAELAPMAASIVHLADILTRCLQFGSGGDPYIPRLEPDAMAALGLRMGDIAPLLDQIHEAFEGIDTSDFS